MTKKHKSRKKQANKCMKKIYSYTGAMGSQLQRPESMGVKCLSQGHLSRDKEVNCHPSGCQPTNPFFERWVGIELPTLWLLDIHTHHWATAAQNTNIQMYEKNTPKNTHTNIWKKHAYKWMTKTRIKNSMQMYDKNPHANVWKKRIQNSMQMYDKNPHANVWKKRIQTRIKMYEKKQAYKCMKKNRHTNV